jgi:hypothetical protein
MAGARVKTGTPSARSWLCGVAEKAATLLSCSACPYVGCFLAIIYVLDATFLSPMFGFYAFVSLRTGR